MKVTIESATGAAETARVLSGFGREHDVETVEDLRNLFVRFQEAAGSADAFIVNVDKSGDLVCEVYDDYIE